MKAVAVRGQVIERARLNSRDGTTWVAKCTDLDVAVPGDTPLNAVLKLMKSLEPFFQTVVEKGQYEKSVEDRADLFRVPEGGLEIGDYLLNEHDKSFIVVIGVDIRRQIPV